MKPIYGHQVVVKESAAFVTGHQARNSGQLVLKIPNSPTGFSKAFLKANWGRRHPGYAVSSYTVLWLGEGSNAAVSQELTLSLLRHLQAWGLCAHIWSSSSSVQFSHSVMSDCLQPHGLQLTKLPRPSPAPRVCASSYPLSRWCHPTISSCS